MQGAESKFVDNLGPSLRDFTKLGHVAVDPFYDLPN